MSKGITIGNHFNKLFNFEGREDRASFWPYATVAFVIILLAGIIVLIPTIYTLQQFGAQHPDQLTIKSGIGHYSILVHGKHPELISSHSILLYLIVTFGLAIMLYAAAVVRRLHDRGKSGFWGLTPLPFIVYSVVQMPRMFAAIGTTAQTDMTLLFSIYFSNLFYMITLIWLIVLLTGQSCPQPNRYDKTA